MRSHQRIQESFVSTLPASLKCDPFLRRLPALPLSMRRRFLVHDYRGVEDILAKLSKRVVGDICINVPEFSCEFFIGATSDLFKRIILHDAYENDLANPLHSTLDP